MIMIAFNAWTRTTKRVVTCLVLAVAVAIAFVARACSDPRKGTQYWFKDRAYHFQALRALQLAPMGAADANEVLDAVGNTTEKNVDSWFQSWYTMARNLERIADSYSDQMDRAQALQRASNYYRTAEFFLAAADPRRKDTWKKHSEHFETALDLLAVRREHLQIPYEDKHLNAVFYPANGPLDLTRPLIVGFNGWDGTITEMYYALVPPGTRRGYNVLLYEGPGQGAVLREQGLRFTPKWHKANTRVLDHVVEHYGKPRKIVLVGNSLGAILVLQAAAKDGRVDGVIASGVLYDALEVSLNKVPGIVRWLYESGHRSVLNLVMRQAAKSDAVISWGLGHTAWTMGSKDETGSLDAVREYHLRDVLHEVTADVLLTQGANDHFGIRTDQMGKTKTGLINARSVTEVVFRKGQGGEEHTQIGALLQMQAEWFKWIDARFGSSR